MSEDKQQSINLNIIIKIIYKNIFLIGLITILMTGLAGFYAIPSLNRISDRQTWNKIPLSLSV